jgi:hypothetical protein
LSVRKPRAKRGFGLNIKTISLRDSVPPDRMAISHPAP